MNGEVTELGHDSMFVSSVPRLGDDLFAGTRDTFFITHILAEAASCKDFGILVIDISAAFVHARLDDEIYVKVPSDVKSSKFWRLKAAVNGTRKASKHWQEYSCDELVKSMLFQQNDINSCIYKRFSGKLEQHADDFLVCGSTSGLKCLADEFKKYFLVMKAEIASLRPEHQKETHFSKRRICADDARWRIELAQRYVRSLLDTVGMNKCKSMATLGSKDQEKQTTNDKLEPQEHREFRSGAGICQYMTEQRLDIAFSTKEIMRDAAGPTTT